MQRSARGGVDNFVDGGARVGGGPRAPDGARLLRLVQVVHGVEHVIVLAAHASEARLTAERTAHRTQKNVLLSPYTVLRTVT